MKIIIESTKFLFIPLPYSKLSVVGGMKLLTCLLSWNCFLFFHYPTRVIAQLEFLLN